MTQRHLDPFNPAAVGYDLEDPEFVAARAQVDRALQPWWDAELRAEAARFRHWAADAVRPHLAAMGPGPYSPRPPAMILAEARQALLDYQRWQETDDGKLYLALVGARNLILRMATEVDGMEAARSRKDGSILMGDFNLRLLNSQLRGEIDQIDSLAAVIGRKELGHEK